MTTRRKRGEPSRSSTFPVVLDYIPLRPVNEDRVFIFNFAVFFAGGGYPKPRIGRAIASAFATFPTAFHPRSYCGGVASASVRPSAAAARSGQ